MKLKKKIISLLFNLIVPIILVIIMNLSYSILNEYIILGARGLIISIIISELIFWMIFCIIGNTQKSIYIYSFFVFLFILLSSIKTITTGDPITINDFNFIGNISDIGNLVVDFSIIYLLKKCYIFLYIGFFLFFICLLGGQFNLQIKSKKRFCGLIIIFVFFIILLFPTKLLRNKYLEIFFGEKERVDYNSYVRIKQYYVVYGMLAGFYGNYLENKISEPINYNEVELDRLLDGDFQESRKDNIGKPNIICVFSEAFWNLDKLDEIKFDTDPAKAYNNLKKEGITVNMISPTYGGLSENVTFEMITGQNMNFFNNGYIPVMSLYKEKNSDKIPSILNELKDNGYESKIVYGRDYYYCENSMKKMGFDEYINYYENGNISEKKGYFLSDEYLINQIIKELEQKDNNKKIFYMVETIENHMPYKKDKFEKYDICINKTNLSQKENETLLAYAQGIYDASEQLKILYEYIKEYKEPTIIIFMGDHLPYLFYDDGKNVINNLEYFNSDDEFENIYRKYNTEALILSNYNADLSNFPRILSPDLLLISLINKMDVPVSNYFKWLNSTSSILPSFNKYIFQDKDGIIYNKDELSDDMKKILELRDNMQYKILKGIFNK